ncbi:MAG: glycosyltransferase family 39 protein [Planctomycetes bacterium]|nr:glycosyltransferase family 39 protein [Planctomycetota bacterium]
MVALGVRGYRLSARSLWFDEAFTWRLVQFPVSEMLRRVGADNSPPLHFLLLRGWINLFGASPSGLRSLSVLLGILTVLGTYLFAAEAFRPAGTAQEAEVTRARGVGLLAAVLVALSAFHVRYSWEVRMYALATALTAFSSWAFFRALRGPSRRRWWLLYGLLALLLAYTHYYGLFTVAAQAVFLAGLLLVREKWQIAAVLRSPTFRHALLAGSVVVVGWLPWLPVFLKQRAQVQGDYWTQPVTGSVLARTCYRMFLQPEYGPTPAPGLELLTADLCVLGLWVLRRRAGPPEWYVIWAAVAPLVFCLVISAYDTKVFGLRFFLMAHLFLLVGLAALVWRVPFAPERVAATALLLAGSLSVLVGFWQDMDVDRRPGARAAADYIHEQRQPGEPVVVCSPLMYFSLLYHAPDRAAHYLYSDGHPIPHFYGTAALTREDLITDAQLRGIPSRRLWAVNMAGGYWGSYRVSVPSGWVERNRRSFREVFGLGEVTVVLYEVERPRAAPPREGRRR